MITLAVHAHMAEHGLSEKEVRRRVRSYLDEIIPHFNVLSYYKLGYNVAKILVNLLYKVSVDYQDERALERIPKRDVVVYLMNHRSNADYIVVAYVLARGVHVSYAVGEWARAWPLEYVFKSFGAYFVRRRFREPLYHTVLERYVQLITRNGVTQGIFPEGGLSRDGKLRPPKLGLLDYICRTVLDPAFDRDVWFAPVALSYDRVLEDRSLIRELIDERDRPSRLAQLGTVLSYLASNTVRLLAGRLKRYGRVAVNFGTPQSLRAWLRTIPENVLSLDPRNGSDPAAPESSPLTSPRRLGGFSRNTKVGIRSPRDGTIGAPGGSDTLATRSRGLAPFVLLSVATHGLFIQVGHSEAPASIPKQPRRVARFTNVGATGQIGSRTDPPHCTSRHHFDVAKATRLASAVRPGELTPGSTSA